MYYLNYSVFYNEIALLLKKKEKSPRSTKIVNRSIKMQKLYLIVFFSIYLSVCMALLGFVVFTTLTLHTDSLRGVY